MFSSVEGDAFAQFLAIAAGFGNAPGTRDVESDAIDARLRREIERLPVGVAPSHVVRMFRPAQRAQRFAVRVENPQAAGHRN